MAKYSTPPPPLKQAIDQAARRYGVPASDLVGIWREESGSTYPNPAVNSSGYGGLFGTTDAFGPTQEQANLSASILATGYQKSGGQQVGALSYYNTGKIDSPAGASYAARVRSLSGQVGRIPIPPSAPTVLGGSSTIASQPARPGGGGGSFWSDVWGGISGAGGAVGHAAEGAWGATEGAAEAAINGPLGFLKAALWLVNPVTWLRAVESLFGFATILAGIAVIVGVDRGIGGAPGVEQLAGAGEAAAAAAA